MQRTNPCVAYEAGRIDIRAAGLRSKMLLGDLDGDGRMDRHGAARQPPGRAVYSASDAVPDRL